MQGKSNMLPSTVSYVVSTLTFQKQFLHISTYSTCWICTYIGWLSAHKGGQETGCNCQGRFSGSIKISYREWSIDPGFGEKDMGVKKAIWGLPWWWLWLLAPNAGGPSLIPRQETRFCMPQLRVYMPQLKILHASTKTRHSQINK